MNLHLTVLRKLVVIFVAFTQLGLLTSCTGKSPTVLDSINNSDPSLSTPKISFSNIPDSINSNTVTLNFDVTGAATVVCSLNNGSSSDCSSKSISYSNLSDGDHTLSVTATSSKGITATDTRVFRKDTQAPVITVSTKPPSSTSLNTATFSFSVTDNLSGIARIQCSLDNAAFANCTSPVNLSGLSQASHNFRIQAWDNAGNASTIYSYNWSVIAAGSPSVNLTSTPAGITNSTSASFSFSGQNAVSYECSLDNATFVACSTPATFSNLAAGNHNFRVQAVSSGGVKSTAAQASWIIDRTNPSAPNITSSVSANTNQTSASFNFSSTDANGIARYECSQNSGVYATCTSPRNLSSLANGSQSLAVRAVDNAGNTSSVSTFSWTVDTVAPALAFVQTPQSSTTLTTDTISFSASDSGSGINLTQCSLDNTAFANCTSPVALVVNLGSHNFRVQVSDRAGNTSNISYSWSVVTATQPPDTTPLTKTGWIPCAREGNVCEFTGSRRVVFGQFTDSFNVIQTRTGPVNCTVEVFGDPSEHGWDSKYCWYEGEVTLPVATTTITGPAIDVTKIPPGFAGDHRLRITDTTELPSPSDDGVGAFRTNCAYSHMAFNDPIVFPNQPGRSHLHTFFGNTDVNAYSTASSIVSTGKSTCNGGIINRTAYWVPSLIDTRTGTPMAPIDSIWYYKTGYLGVVPASLRNDLPAGLRMIAGKSNNTTKPPDYTAVYQWHCIIELPDGSDTHTDYQDSMPNCPVGSKLAMVIEFPQCWDGVNLDSADHQSHMAYANNGCPASHPIPLPVISLNIMWKVPAMGPYYRLSSDNYSTSLPGGYSTHADWFNGWDPAFSSVWMQQCLKDSKDCHAHLIGGGKAAY